MSEIQSLGLLNPLGLGSTQRHESQRRQTGKGDVAEPVDQVEISELAKFFSRLTELPANRARKVVEVRGAIMSETYDIEPKLDVAIDRLIAELGV